MMLVSFYFARMRGRRKEQIRQPGDCWHQGRISMLQLLHHFRKCATVLGRVIAFGIIDADFDRFARG
jgi:hypothetical protein